MNSEDKIHIFWDLSKEYSDNIMFDVQTNNPSEFVLPVLLLRDSSYLPFTYKGLEVKVRHRG